MNPEVSPFNLQTEDLDYIVDAVGSRWEHLRDQELLITGGTGFIGKWLLASFLHANRRLNLKAQATVLSRRPEIFIAEFPSLRDADDVKWLIGDVRQRLPVTSDGYTFAIHAATDVAATSTPAEILDTCSIGTRRVLDAMSRRGRSRRRVLLLSSGAVYGRTPSEIQTIPEEWIGAPDPLTPASAYGEGKRVSELMCAMAGETQTGLEIAIARCFAFVGPHLPLDKHFAIGNFIAAAMQGKDIQIQGDGTPLRSYLYAADLAHWLWVMLFDAPHSRAYNVGGAEALSISELAHRVNRVLSGSGNVRVARTPTPGVRPQAYVPSVKRIAAEMGLVPRIDLDSAILRTARWASQHFPGRT